MNEEFVEIYEFRRGFTYKPQAESWVSTGFYGSKYVGITFRNGEIPQVIIRAIQEQAFNGCQFVDIHQFHHLSNEEYNAIGSKRFNEKFTERIALIGRVVDKWSVLAVITFALDFCHRIFPVQRYFCCQEAPDYDAMATLITWWSETRKIFDTHDNDPEDVYTYSPIRQDNSEKLSNKDNCNYVRSASYPNLYLVHPGIEDSKDSILQIWFTCLQLTHRNNAAWAFNVHSLKKPELFTLVQAGTEEFYKKNISIYPSVKNSPPKNNNTFTSSSLAIIGNQVTLKTVLIEFKEIGSLSSTENIELLKQQIVKGYPAQMWQNLFEQVFDDCTEEKNLIYLLTLQAVILPEKTTELLQKLVYSNKKLWDDFMKSQNNISHLKLDIDNCLEEGIWYVLNSLVERKIKLSIKNILVSKLFFRGLVIDNFFDNQIIWIKALHKSLEQLWSPNVSVKNYEDSSQIESQYRDLFLENIEKPKYRNKYKKGYKFIIEICKRKRIYSLLRAMIYQKINNNVPVKLYEHIESQYKSKYPAFVDSLQKKTTLKEKIQRCWIKKERKQAQVIPPQHQVSTTTAKQPAVNSEGLQDNGYVEFLTIIAAIAFILCLLTLLLQHFVYQVNLIDTLFLLNICIFSLVVTVIGISWLLFINNKR